MKKQNCFLFVAILLCGTMSFAQNSQDTLRILFVGNSYTYVSNMPHLVSLISDFTPTKLITSKSVAGGANLGNHWRGEKGLKTMDLIRNNEYDIIVLQDQSMSAIEQPDSLLAYTRKFSEYIRENGARPYLYCTWARERVPQYQKAITEIYSQSASENNIGIVKVGEVWKHAQSLRPGIELYQADGSHQSPLGAFVTACSFVKELSKELPAKLPPSYKAIDARGESVELMFVHPLDITFCVKVVNQVIN